MKNPFQLITLIVILVLLPGTEAFGRPTAQEEFKSTIQPFLRSYCIACHNPDKNKGKLSLEAISGTIEKETNASLWATILHQLELEDMPPEDAKKHPDGSERKHVMDWIRSELGHAGFERDPNLLERPEFGNHINHKKLFDGSITTPSYSEPRVWRLRAELFPMGSPFPKTEFDYAALQSIAEPETMRLRALSEEIAYDLLDYALGRKERHRNSRHNPPAVRYYGVPNLANPSIYINTAKPDRADIEADIQTLFKLFINRTPEDREVKRYSDFLERMLNSESDREGALATAIRAMILTPESIYRMEIGLGEELPDGRIMLSERELGVAVPMSLGRKTPIANLKTRADVDAAVKKMFKQNRATNGPGKTPHGITPLFMEFMHQYFGYHKAPEVFKGDRHAYHQTVTDKGFTHAFRLVDETDKIVAHILRDDRDVFRRLLTTDQILVSRQTGGDSLEQALSFYKTDWKWNREPIQKVTRKNDLASRGVFKNLSYMAYYNLTPNSGTSPKEFIPSPVPRAGVLTQPSWLIAHSTFTDNHVVLRGKWIREKLLGDSIPEVPIGVDAAIPDDPHLPLRTRLKSTRQEFCWRCHHRMDPLGYPFEMYDDFGRFREDHRERLIDGTLHDQPVDTRGEILSSGDPQIDGPVKDAVEMIRRIADSSRARQVFVRHVFRFFMGRNETLADSQTLITADRTYTQSGGSFEALVGSILTSDSFLYRKQPDKK